MTRRFLAAHLAVVLLTVASAAGASAAKADGVHADPAWRDAPAWTAVVPPYGGVRAIPATVCPFGISDVAAYTRDGRRRDRYVTGARNRYLVNSYYRGLRVYIFCG